MSSSAVFNPVAVTASAPRVLSRGEQVIALELGSQVNGLGIDGAPVQLERTQPAVHEQSSLTDGEPMGRPESVPL